MYTQAWFGWTQHLNLLLYGYQLLMRMVFDVRVRHYDVTCYWPKQCRPDGVSTTRNPSTDWFKVPPPVPLSPAVHSVLGFLKDEPPSGHVRECKALRNNYRVPRLAATARLPSVRS